LKTHTIKLQTKLFVFLQAKHKYQIYKSKKQETTQHTQQ